MAVPNRPKSQNKYTPQNMGNTSFDEDFGVNTVENLVYNPKTDALDRMTQAELPPNDATKNNPVYVFTYDGDNITKIEMTYGGVTYSKTLTYNGNNVTDISAWT